VPGPDEAWDEVGADVSRGPDNDNARHDGPLPTGPNAFHVLTCQGRLSSLQISEETDLTNPLIKQVAHTCIFARDLDAVEAFYRDVLGVAPKFDFKRGEDRIGFYLDFGNRTFVEVFRKGESRFEESNQINHICFETDDIDAFMTHAKAKGVSVTDKKLGVDHTWQCWLADPSGVKIEIFQYTKDSMQFGPSGVVCQVDW
jgi:catechol 2,3-dioxygenase-like lactoylglutathione lyase family enzyme